MAQNRFRQGQGFKEFLAQNGPKTKRTERGFKFSIFVKKDENKSSSCKS